MIYKLYAVLSDTVEFMEVDRNDLVELPKSVWENLSKPHMIETTLPIVGS